MLKGALGVGAATVLGLRPASGQTATARIAIIGAGLAGLTAAYRLKQAGFDPIVFEGNTRLGGRCFTARGAFKNGQIVEHGGEFIDTDHYEIRGLAKELGLTLYDVLAAQPPGAIPVYRFNGERYTLADATADFGQLYLDLKGQSAAIGGSYGYQYSTAAAKRYDVMTARTWIETYVSGGLSSKLGQLIDNAFTEENAADTDHQSALNIITTLADDQRDDFDLYYTDSDQRFRVLGGNDQIPTLLGAELPGAIETGTALVAIRKRDDGRIVITTVRGGQYRDALFDRVVLALPFAVMRAAVDFANAGFQPLKVQAISQLGMGASVKFQLQFERRLWNAFGCNGEIRLPSPAFQDDMGCDAGTGRHHRRVSISGPADRRPCSTVRRPIGRLWRHCVWPARTRSCRVSRRCGTVYRRWMSGGGTHGRSGPIPFIRPAIKRRCSASKSSRRATSSLPANTPGARQATSMPAWPRANARHGRWRRLFRHRTSSIDVTRAARCARHRQTRASFAINAVRLEDPGVARSAVPGPQAR